MTYEAAYNYLIKSYVHGKKRGFDFTKIFLEKLDNPQEKLKIIHVAGTNGKGSVCAMLSSILQEAGYKTGVFTSPHLHKFNERFAINGKNISDEDFARYIEVVKNISIEILGNQDESFSYFEILTLVGFMYFYDEKVDYLILEVGMGGRADVTNIIKKPLLSIITSISLDHMEVLGKTIEEIAAEKSGIIKKNCPVVLYFQNELVYNKIKEVALSVNSELFYSDVCQISILKNDLRGICFSVDCGYFSYDCINLMLLGEYQIRNAVTVLLAAYALKQYGVLLTKDNVVNGLKETLWAGRMEIIPAGLKMPVIVLEGAHNLEGAQMLNKSVSDYFGGKSVTIVIGILKDKEYEKMVNVLSEKADKIILTKPVYAARALEPSKLYNAIENKNKTIITESDYKAAIDLAVKITPKNGIICCTGSLYLIGDVRAYVRDR